MDYSLGVDIGGTKIAAGIVDEKGNCSDLTELPSIKTDREEMFQQVLACIEKVLDKSQQDLRTLKGIGIGVPGKVDSENGIAVFQNNLPWTNFPLVKRIKEHLPIKNIVIDNDVYMATFAEWKVRGENDRETFVYLTISTGISCCTIHNRAFIRGTGFAGEIGFSPINTEGQRLEEIASGPGIERLAEKYFSTRDENAVNMNVKRVLEDFRFQKPYAVKVMNEVLKAFAKGLYSISCLLDPDKLVLGGGVMNHNPELLDHMKKSLESFLVTDQMDLLNRMEVSRLKGNSGLIGAGLRAHSFSDLRDGLI